MGAAATPEEVQEFISTNGLDSNASQSLLALDPVSQKNILNFGGLSNCRNPSAVCLARIRELKQGSGGAHGSEVRHPDASGDADSALKAAIERFLKDNNVDSRAAATLRVQSLDVQRLVVERGELTDCTNPSAALMGRIQVAKDNVAFQKKQPGGGGAVSSNSAPQGTTGPKEQNPEIESFITENKLDDMAARQLRDEEPSIQAEVLARGGLEDCRNPSAVCLARIREAKNARKAEKEQANKTADPSPAMNQMMNPMAAMMMNPMLMMQQAYMQQAAYAQSMAYMQSLAATQQMQMQMQMQAQAQAGQATSAAAHQAASHAGQPAANQPDVLPFVPALENVATVAPPPPEDAQEKTAAAAKEPVTKAPPPDKQVAGTGQAQAAQATQQVTHGYVQYYGQLAVQGQHANAAVPQLPAQAAKAPELRPADPPLKAPAPAPPPPAEKIPVAKQPPPAPTQLALAPLQPPPVHTPPVQHPPALPPPAPRPPPLPANVPFAGWSVGVPSSMQAAPPPSLPPPEDPVDPGASSIAIDLSKLPGVMPTLAVAPVPPPPSGQPPVKQPPPAPWKKFKTSAPDEASTPQSSAKAGASAKVAAVPKQPKGSGYGPWAGGGDSK